MSMTASGALAALLKWSGIAFVATLVTSVFAPFDASIFIGNLCGSFVYLFETTESHRSRKIVYFSISLVLGYKIAQRLAAIFAWIWPELAGAAASALVVGALLALYKQGQKSFPSIFSKAGDNIENRVDRLTGGDGNA